MSGLGNRLSDGRRLDRRHRWVWDVKQSISETGTYTGSSSTLNVYVIWRCRVCGREEFA